jgi:hypothetical protein
MIFKLAYYIIRLFSKRKALDYAIKRQVISMKNKNSLEWYYWFEKIK